MPLNKIPYVRRVRGGLFEVDDRAPSELTAEQKKLVNRIIACNDELCARKLLDFIRKRCKSGKFSRRCGGCAGSHKKNRKASQT